MTDIIRAIDCRSVVNGMHVMQAGRRSTVSSSILQLVEIRNCEEERFERLLQLLSEHNEEEGKVLVFVNSQHKCSKLYQDLLHYGYSNLMLHGDMPQVWYYVCKPAFGKVYSSVQLALASFAQDAGLTFKFEPHLF
jgi:superfamily II DNA/RNA helicase